MHEIEPFVDTASLSGLHADTPETVPAPAAPAVREGLPPGFRMRADAHYVDQLDARMSSIPVRLIDTQAIDTAHHHSEAVTAAFVDSVRQLGVLQPLLVAAHGSRYTIIAGRRRLAAAVAAGLREVPCLVQHVDGDRAERMALASNLPATRARAAATSASSPAGTAGVTADLAHALATIVSCADLIPQASSFSQGAATAMVKAEAGRALEMLLALQVLRDEVSIGRSLVSAASILATVHRAAAAGQCLRGPSPIGLTIEQPPATVSLTGDARLLASAVSALVSATASVLESIAGPSTDDDPRAILIGAAADAGGRVCFSVRQATVDLPSAWLARPFDIAWPTRDGASTQVRLQAARKIAHAHGGDIEMEPVARGSSFVLTVRG